MLRVVILIELTCPAEEGIAEAATRKELRYKPLKAEIEDKTRKYPWTAHLLTIEAGARGFVANSMKAFLKKVGFSNKQACRVCKDISEVTARCSYGIWLMRDNKCWNSSRQLVVPQTYIFPPPLLIPPELSYKQKPGPLSTMNCTSITAALAVPVKSSSSTPTPPSPPSSPPPSPPPSHRPGRPLTSPPRFALSPSASSPSDRKEKVARRVTGMVLTLDPESRARLHAFKLLRKSAFRCYRVKRRRVIYHECDWDGTAVCYPRHSIPEGFFA